MSDKQTERTSAERITLMMSVIVLAGILTLVGWSHYRTGTTPPQIEVQVHTEKIRESGSRYYLPITITNTGGLTGQDVTITGTLINSEGEEESAEVSFLFLAGGESEEAELVFATDPAEGDLSVGATSFTYP